MKCRLLSLFAHSFFFTKQHTYINACVQTINNQSQCLIFMRSVNIYEKRKKSLFIKINYDSKKFYGILFKFILKINQSKVLDYYFYCYLTQSIPTYFQESHMPINSNAMKNHYFIISFYTKPLEIHRQHVFFRIRKTL